MFDFPIHTSEVMNRASSRESNFSESSRSANVKTKTTRSRIGDSPLTSKEFNFNDVSPPPNNIQYPENTVGDNYRNGLKPSERMKKFSSGHEPGINDQYVHHHSMVDEYNNLGSARNETETKGSTPSKNVTQNLRLLKNKMRLGSANSNSSEPYTNTVVRNHAPSSASKTRDRPIRGVQVNDPNSSYENIHSTTRKQKPVRADHRMFKPKRQLNETETSKSDASGVFTPKKSLIQTSKNKPYETASGGKFMRSTMRSVASEGGESKYLTTAEIEKLADPKSSMQQLAKDLSSKDWEVQVNACNVLRSIAIHNTNLLDSSFFRSAFPDLIKIASSLRSSVCKNGLLVFQDLFNN